MTRAKGLRPGGRPLKLHSVVDRAPDGTPITAGAKIIARVRSVWQPWEDAAASAGVAARTIRDWRRQGASARERITNWQPGQAPVTANERHLADFVTDLEQAESEVHGAHLGVITAASKGGLSETRTVETVVGGVVKSVVTTTVTRAPLWTASAWMLQHRRPDLYRTRHELTGADGEPLATLAERQEAIGAWLEGYLTGQSDGATTTEPAATHKPGLDTTPHVP